MTTLEMHAQPISIINREELFTEFYKTSFPIVAHFVSKRNGTLAEAKDIFQDALVILYEKLVDGKLENCISHEAYLLGIAKHLWIHKFKHDLKNISLTDFESAITIPDDYFPEIQTTRLMNILELAGKKCLELLTAFYYHKNTIQRITHDFGYTSERSATVQKYKCMEKMRDTVKVKLMNYEDFTE